MLYPDSRTVRRALGVLERLPAEARAELTQRLIDRLDAAGPDPDLEPEKDCCEADDDHVGPAAFALHAVAGTLEDGEEDNEDCCAPGECGGVLPRFDNEAGDPDAEPDNEDGGAGEDEPAFQIRRRVRGRGRRAGKWVSVPIDAFCEAAPGSP